MASSMRGGRNRKLKAEINVVPYIDVMLVLLVIFMVSAPLTNPGVINLPKAERSALPPTEYIQVALRPNAASTISIRGKRNGRNPGTETTAANRDDLLQQLRELHQQNPDLPVMVSADKDIKYDEVIHVVSEAKKFGIDRVGLATKQ